MGDCRRAETLAKWLEEPDTLRHRLAEMPFKHPYNGENVRVCRVEAISGLQESFARADSRALIQMATGAGKALNACAFTYRLIKHAGARNVLFLVDRANLGRQAMAEFQQFVTPTAASSPSSTTSSTSPRTSSMASAASPSAPSNAFAPCSALCSFG